MDAATAHNFRWDFAAAALFSFFNVVFNQFYVPISLQHGASDFQVGLLTAAPAIGLLFSPLWANIMGSGPAKPFVVLPNLAARMLLIIPAFYADPAVFVAVALVFHLLNGIQAPAYAALMTRTYPAEQRGRLMGNVRVAMGLLMTPMAWITGRWIDESGSSGPLLAAAVVGVLSTIAFQQLRENTGLPAPRIPPRPKGTFMERMRLLGSNRPILIFLAATSLTGFGNMLAGPLYNIYQVNELGLTNEQISYLRVAYFACLLVAYLAAGWMVDRYSPKVAMSFGLLALTVNPLLYGLIGSYGAVMVASGIQGMSDAIWDIGCMAFVFHFARGREAVVFGLHLMLFGIRGTIGPLLGTSLYEPAAFQSIMLVCGGFGLSGLVLFLAVKLRQPEPLPDSR